MPCSYLLHPLLLSIHYRHYHNGHAYSRTLVWIWGEYCNKSCRYDFTANNPFDAKFSLNKVYRSIVEELRERTGKNLEICSHESKRYGKEAGSRKQTAWLWKCIVQADSEIRCFMFAVFFIITELLTDCRINSSYRIWRKSTHRNDICSWL